MNPDKSVFLPTAVLRFWLDVHNFFELHRKSIEVTNWLCEKLSHKDEINSSWVVYMLIIDPQFLQDHVTPYQPPRFRNGEATTSRSFRFYGQKLARRIHNRDRIGLYPTSIYGQMSWSLYCPPQFLARCSLYMSKWNIVRHIRVRQTWPSINACQREIYLFPSLSWSTLVHDRLLSWRRRVQVCWRKELQPTSTNAFRCSASSRRTFQLRYVWVKPTVHVHLIAKTKRQWQLWHPGSRFSWKFLFRRIRRLSCEGYHIS